MQRSLPLQSSGQNGWCWHCREAWKLVFLSWFGLDLWNFCSTLIGNTSSLSNSFLPLFPWTKLNLKQPFFWSATQALVHGWDKFWKWLIRGSGISESWISSDSKITKKCTFVWLVWTYKKTAQLKTTDPSYFLESITTILDAHSNLLLKKTH